MIRESEALRQAGIDARMDEIEEKVDALKGILSMICIFAAIALWKLGDKK